MSKNPVSAERPRYDTTYFPEHVVREGVCGACHDFAVALHRKTKWPIAALWSLPNLGKNAMFGDSLPVHVFCVCPDGRGVDAEGAHTMDELVQRYTLKPDHPRRLEVHGDEDAWTKTCEGSNDSTVQEWRRSVTASQPLPTLCQALRSFSISFVISNRSKCNDALVAVQA